MPSELYYKQRRPKSKTTRKIPLPASLYLLSYWDDAGKPSWPARIHVFLSAGKGFLEEFRLRTGSAGAQERASLYRKAVFLFPLSGNCDSLVSMALLYDKRLPSRLFEEVLLGRMLKLSWGGKWKWK